MMRRILERLTQFPFNMLSDATPIGHPAHPDSKVSWKKWHKAMVKWGARFESTVPPHDLTLTPWENYKREVSLLCPDHFSNPAILPGGVCPFDKWPEDELPPC